MFMPIFDRYLIATLFMALNQMVRVDKQVPTLARSCITTPGLTWQGLFLDNSIHKDTLNMVLV